MPRWIRGHVSVLRITISAVATIAGVLLAVLPFAAVVKVSAPVVACLVLFGMYMWAELGHSETAASQAHIKDLQDFAGWAEQLVAMPVGFDFTTPKAKSFRAHFPRLGKQIDEWNSLMQQLPVIDKQFAQFINDEPIRLSVGVNTGLPSMLSLMGRRLLLLSDLTWEVQGGWIHVVRSDGGRFALVPLPSDDESTCKLLSTLWESLTTVSEKPAGREYELIHQKVELLRVKLYDGLRTVEARHRPEGHCELCPT